MVHNSYQIKGGEDSVVLNECNLLRSHGHDVTVFQVDNSYIRGFFSKLVVAIFSIFSVFGYFKMRRVIKKTKPDVVHVHNYFPILSPSIFWACHYNNVPVVHTLHNFRAICPTAILMWKGKVVEKSISSSSSWWTLSKKVYKNSFLGTFFLILMVEINKKIGTWSTAVDGYIALTDFSKKKYVSAGWPEDRIYIKPNFSDYRGGSLESRENFALYVGRLSEEKGVRFLVDCFRGSGLSIKFVGDGPLNEYLESHGSNNIENLGRLPKEEVLSLMSRASCLVMASTWYEGFPMVIVEALGCGLPVIVPKLGNMEAVVTHDLCGLHYTPKDNQGFINAASKVITDPSVRERLSIGALKEFDAKYTPSENLTSLIEIYKKVIKRKDGGECECLSD
tara:strand:+ start:5046 stop:6221 length:1176 start_codon:yes stop_codon:yes gene_type:complete